MKKIHLLIVVCLVLFPLNAVANKPFRFALFTDTHISTANSIPTQDLGNAIADVNSLQNIDFVLVDGDISNLGDTASLKVAKQMLQNLKIPFYIVPGNHDFRWNVNNGSADFVRIFGNNRFFFTHNGFLFVGFTTVPNQKYGNAIVQSSDIKWISKIIRKNGKLQPTFIITHYPLLTGDVDNWKELTESLKLFNVKAVINGHYHRNVLLNYDGIPGIVNRSTQRSKNHLGGYSIYSVNDSLSVYEKQIGEPEFKWLTLPLR